jgi:tetratricopeptide (TPR) repeat protein
MKTKPGVVLSLLSFASVRLDLPAHETLAMKSNPSSWRAYRHLANILTIILTLSLASVCHAAVDSGEQVCNPTADYFLGNEDYAEAVRLHRLIIQEHPNDPLAHYHLGFAEGMMGQSAEEIDQYQAAVRLGLRDWGLFLNLGRAYLEQGQLAPATNALQTSVKLGPEHAEAHFNLGLAYERQGLLTPAAAELTKALSLDPSQNDANNMLAVVNAEQGNYRAAQTIWIELIRAQPNFAAARANLAILEASLKQSDPGSTRLSPRSFQSASASDR